MPTPLPSHRLPQYDPRTLLNSQPVIVTVIDPVDHTVQFQNDTGLKKFGDIRGAACYEKIAACSAPCEFCLMPEAVATGQVMSKEVPLADNQYLLIHWSKAETEDGRLHVIETITDISEHKRLEHSLQQSQKMEALGRLAGGIAHDFNNLLMIILGHAHRLAQHVGAHPARQEVEIISQAGTRAAALTKKLLTFSRRQVLEQTHVNPTALIRDMEDILRRLIGEQIQTVIVLDPNTGYLLGDPVQLEQIILNLALNGRDAMPDGGILTIETGNADLDDDYVRAHLGSNAGPYVKIAVEDTGCGIEPEHLSRIFEPFFTTKEYGKGTGLGLATVYGIVKQSRGYIEVASQPGKGSKFTVYLPRVARRVDAPEPLSPVSKQPAGREAVLVAEDDEGIRRLIGVILKDQGYQVLEAGDGVEALQLLQTFKGTCRLLITDVIMPRMKSAALVEGVRAMIPDIQVLYMSGYAGDTLEANGITREAAFLQKPFLPGVLTDKVHELLAAR